MNRLTAPTRCFLGMKHNITRFVLLPSFLLLLFPPFSLFLCVPFSQPLSYGDVCGAAPSILIFGFLVQGVKDELVIEGPQNKFRGTEFYNLSRYVHFRSSFLIYHSLPKTIVNSRGGQPLMKMLLFSSWDDASRIVSVLYDVNMWLKKYLSCFYLRVATIPSFPVSLSSSVSFSPLLIPSI